MEYLDGVDDCLQLVEHWLNECPDIECIRKKVEYYRLLVGDKKVAHLKRFLEALE